MVEWYIIHTVLLVYKSLLLLTKIKTILLRVKYIKDSK